jgi:hypothetical protein
MIVQNKDIEKQEIRFEFENQQAMVAEFERLSKLSDKDLAKDIVGKIQIKKNMQ